MRFETSGALFALALAGSPASAEVLPQTLAHQLGVTAAETQRLIVPATPESRFEVEVTLDGSRHTLELELHSVRADSFRLIVQHPDGSYEDVAAPPVQTYRGGVRGVADSSVTGYLTHGGLSAEVRLPHLEGIVGISPLATVDPTAPLDAHAVYLGVDELSFGACGVVEEGVPGAEFVPSPSGGLAGVGNPKVAMVGCDTDFEFFQDNASSVPQSEGYIEGVINNVSAIYETQMGLEYDISAIIVRTGANDPYTTTNASSFLNQFDSHWTFFQGGIQRDFAHLFTGKDLNDNTIGIAKLNTMCFISQAYGLSENFNGPTQTTLTAHEIGHNWSANHCNALDDCRIMCDNVGGVGCTPGTTDDFGSFSINTILNKKASVNCLSDPQPPSAPMLASIVPQFVDAIHLTDIVLSGSNFADATEIQIGGLTLSAPLEFTVVSSSSITIPKVIAQSIGTNTVTVTTPAGTSNAGLLFVAETNPPLITNPGLGIPGFPFAWDIGAVPNELYVLNFSLSNQTVDLGGVDVLAFSGVIFSGALTPAGTAQQSVIAPILGFLTLYFQATFFDPVSFNFTGATNVSTAVIF